MSILGRCIAYLQSPGLCPGVVSSLDVAHSLIHFGICPFTLGRRKEIQGVKEGERVREELSNHIWVDGTHGESTAVSPHFSCTLIPGLYVLQPFLFYSSENPPPQFPPSRTIPPLHFLFLPHQSTLYPLQSPPPSV